MSLAMDRKALGKSIWLDISMENTVHLSRLCPSTGYCCRIRQHARWKQVSDEWKLYTKIRWFLNHLLYRYIYSHSYGLHYYYYHCNRSTKRDKEKKCSVVNKQYENSRLQLLLIVCVCCFVHSHYITLSLPPLVRMFRCACVCVLTWRKRIVALDSICASITAT